MLWSVVGLTPAHGSRCHVCCACHHVCIVVVQMIWVSWRFSCSWRWLLHDITAAPLSCFATSHVTCTSVWATLIRFLSSVLWHCRLGNRTGIQSIRVGCWYWRWRFDWSLAHLIVPVVTTTSIILSSN